MEVFELDLTAIKQLQVQGFNLVEKANLIYSGYFFPDCDNPPTLEWDELTTGVHLLLDDFKGRDFEVRFLINPCD